MGGKESLDIIDAGTKELKPAGRVGAIVAMASLDPNLAADRALTMLKATEGDKPDSADVTAMVNGLLGRKGAPAALVEALSKTEPGAIPTDNAKLGVRAVRASGRDESALLDAFSKAGKLASGPVALTDAEMKDLVVEVREHGDPVRGEAIFRRAENQCMNCHAIAGAGGQVGPGLESIGASSARLPRRVAPAAEQGGEGRLQRAHDRHDRRSGDHRREASR